MISKNGLGSTSQFMKIKDFVDGTDKIALDSTVKISELSFSQYKEHVVIWQKNTSKVFGVLENTTLSELSSNDFVSLEVV